MVPGANFAYGLGAGGLLIFEGAAIERQLRARIAALNDLYLLSRPSHSVSTRSAPFDAAALIWPWPRPFCAARRAQAWRWRVRVQ